MQADAQVVAQRHQVVVKRHREMHENLLSAVALVQAMA